MLSQKVFPHSSCVNGSKEGTKLVVVNDGPNQVSVELRTIGG